MTSLSPTQPLQTRWAVRPPAAPSEVKALCQTLKVPPLLASILIARGLGEDTNSQLEPTLTLTQIPDLDKAAARLEDALKQKRRIMIHGDYDADGISGTAVLTLGLRALGGNIIPFLPNRLSDGYGIHPERVHEHKERCELFITVDCGISNLAEIKLLQAAGVEVIVSDHHQPGSELPQCLIVHPKMSPQAQAGLPELTGAGVAYHLLWALHERLGLEPPLEYSDLATIGTIADVAPLMGENRALIATGLQHMADSHWPGLRAAIAQSRLRGAPSARDVAFVLAPRLNAAGRLGEAELGLELLMTASERRARELAVYLDARNTERRGIQDDMFASALEKVDPSTPAIVLESEGWHAGIMGIVASKLLEKFYKPVFIMTHGKGSVRSTSGISAVAALDYAAHTLERYGGHSQAAGFAIQDGKIPDFREAIFDFMSQHPTPQPSLVADALLSGEEISDDLYKAVAGLEPYGQGHPSPIFALTDNLDMARAVGKGGNTLQLRVAGVKGVAWQKGELAQSLRPGQSINAAVSLRESFWQQKRSLEFIADNLRVAEPLGFELEDKEDSGPQIYRTAPLESQNAVLVKNPADLEDVMGKTLHLTELPLAANSLSATESLANLLDADALYFDLATSLPRLQPLSAYPTLDDVRRAFVCLQRGVALPYGEEKNRLIGQILGELELVNEHGKPYRGQKRNPYESETLVASLMQRYVLSSFVKAYKYLDDAAFARTVQILFKN